MEEVVVSSVGVEVNRGSGGSMVVYAPFTCHCGQSRMMTHLAALGPEFGGLVGRGGEDHVAACIGVELDRCELFGVALQLSLLLVPGGRWWVVASGAAATAAVVVLRTQTE